jgi:hypothetical protein
MCKPFTNDSSSHSPSSLLRQAPHPMNNRLWLREGKWLPEVRWPGRDRAWMGAQAPHGRLHSLTMVGSNRVVLLPTRSVSKAEHSETILGRTWVWGSGNSNPVAIYIFAGVSKIPLGPNRQLASGLTHRPSPWSFPASKDTVAIVLISGHGSHMSHHVTKTSILSAFAALKSQ